MKFQYPNELMVEKIDETSQPLDKFYEELSKKPA
jgi:hypothetical protein